MCAHMVHECMCAMGARAALPASTAPLEGTVEMPWPPLDPTRTGAVAFKETPRPRQLGPSPGGDCDNGAAWTPCKLLLHSAHTDEYMASGISCEAGPDMTCRALGLLCALSTRKCRTWPQTCSTKSARRYSHEAPTLRTAMKPSSNSDRQGAQPWHSSPCIGDSLIPSRSGVVVDIPRQDRHACAAAMQCERPWSSHPVAMPAEWCAHWVSRCTRA